MTLTFGQSKGLTFDRVLIYPTQDMLKWVSKRDTKLADKTRAQFYVALTRSKYRAAIASDNAKDIPIDILRWSSEY